MDYLVCHLWFLIKNLLLDVFVLLHQSLLAFCLSILQLEQGRERLPSVIGLLHPGSAITSQENNSTRRHAVDSPTRVQCDVWPRAVEEKVSSYLSKSKDTLIENYSSKSESHPVKY